MSRSKSLPAFFICCAVAFSAGALGAVASIHAASFYQELSRPTWAPPAGVFGPVWTALYTCMAVASWLVWNDTSTRRRAALTIYSVQLALNALWSWLFFAWRQGQWAFIEVLILWAAILLTVVLFSRVRAWAAWLLVPYLLWVSFAVCLTYSVWQRNPALLR